MEYARWAIMPWTMVAASVWDNTLANVRVSPARVNSGILDIVPNLFFLYGWKILQHQPGEAIESLAAVPSVCFEDE